jgi:hypothetical protein
LYSSAIFVGEYVLKEAIICSDFPSASPLGDDAWWETQDITCYV